MNFANFIRTVPNHPKPGVLFRDVTTLFQNAGVFREAIATLSERYGTHRIDAVAGIEARGFIVGAPLAMALGVGFLTLRKPGRLPAPTRGWDYALEYGTDRIEAHVDCVDAGAHVLIADDLLATGGTALAATKLLREMGAVVEHAAFLVDLPDLGGGERLRSESVQSAALVSFAGH